MAILSEASKILSDTREVTLYKLLNDKAALNTASTAVVADDAEALTLIVEASAGVSAGVVTLEGALTADYAGTWHSLGTVTTNAASKNFSVNTTALPMPYVRARISTAITAGTVDVYIQKRK